jgi:hypothetical protein
MWHRSFLQSEGRLGPKIAARLATILILAWVGAAGAALAQDANANAPVALPNGGLQVRTVAAYVGYYSNGLANTGGLQTGAANLQYDVGGGASATFEYTKLGERSSFSMSYTPSYTGQIRYSSLNTLNHAFSLNASRKLAPRWNFGFSVAGDLSSLQQSLFTPTALSNVAAVPSTFDDLAAGMLSSKFTNNPQLANVLTSAPLAQSPLLSLLYGQRIFTSSAHISLSYSYSPRLSVTFSGSGSRMQPVSDGQTSTSNTVPIANTTSGNAGVAISYALSPLTQLGGTLTTSRVSSSLQDAYITTSLATLGRTLGRRWFAQIHGGVGVTNPIRQTAFTLSTKPYPAIGGSMGFRTISYTLLGSYDRSVSDPYGAGASTSSTATGTWRWRQPGHAWLLESSVSWQQLGNNALTNTALINTALTNISGWNISAGFGRAVGAHLALHTEYSYLYYGRRAPNSLSQSAVRVSLVWTRNSTSLQ